MNVLSCNIIKQGKTKRAIPKDTPVKTHSHTILSIDPDGRLRLFQIDDSNVIVLYRDSTPIRPIAPFNR